MENKNFLEDELLEQVAGGSNMVLGDGYSVKIILDMIDMVKYLDIRDYNAEQGLIDTLRELRRNFTLSSYDMEAALENIELCRLKMNLCIPRMFAEDRTYFDRIMAALDELEGRTKLG